MALQSHSTECITININFQNMLEKMRVNLGGWFPHLLVFGGKLCKKSHKTFQFYLSCFLERVFPNPTSFTTSVSILSPINIHDHGCWPEKNILLCCLLLFLLLVFFPAINRGQDMTLIITGLPSMTYNFLDPDLFDFSPLRSLINEIFACFTMHDNNEYGLNIWSIYLVHVLAIH